MKILEPISSALLITGCIYAAGTSQNNAFMREFGINPEFSQPSIDKILYDGGLITFEIFYAHLKLAAITLFAVFLLFCVAWVSVKLLRPGYSLVNVSARLRAVFNILAQAPVGFLLLLYITYMCFASYQKSQEVGVRLSETFMERCHWVVLQDKKNTTKACAFRKDKDSIWYYTLKNGGIDINSKLLTDLVQVTYLEPKTNVDTSVEAQK
ncbi:hypothetical protein [Pseudomonas cerasi]